MIVLIDSPSGSSRDDCGLWGRLVGGDGSRLGPRHAEGDPDRVEPAPDVPVYRWCPQRHLFVELPFDRMEDERLRLRAAETAVGADQLFEGRHLAELWVVLTEQQQVWRVGHRVLALQAHDRV